MPPAGHSVTGTLADKPQCDCFSKAGSGDAVAESRCPPDIRRDHPASRPMSECRAGAAPPSGRTSRSRPRSEAVRTGSETRRTAHYRGRRSVPRRTRRRTTRTGSASRRGSEQCPRGSGATFPKAFTGPKQIVRNRDAVGHVANPKPFPPVPLRNGRPRRRRGCNLGLSLATTRPGPSKAAPNVSRWHAVTAEAPQRS